jgi:hypothetical protein
MKTLLPSFVVAAALCSGLGARTHAAITILHVWDGVDLEIPDGPGFGEAITVSDTRRVTTAFETITDLSVWLRFEGSDGAGGLGTMWNGDLHVTLTHESGASMVLLNRIGRDPAHPYGAAGNGLDLTLDPTALTDVHLAGNGYLSGIHQPDGRGQDPTTVVTASARDAGFDQLLATFGDGSPMGSWTLAVTDLETGNLARLSGWGMTLTGVPEPEEYAAMAGAGLVLFGVWRRRRQRSVQVQ